MGFIDEVVRTIENPEDYHALKYLQLDLIAGEYDPAELAEAINNPEARARLGYLAETTAQSVERTNLPNYGRLSLLASSLYEDRDDWIELNPNASDLCKRIFHNDRSNPTANKWRVRGYFRDDENDAWIKQHLPKHHV